MKNFTLLISTKNRPFLLERALKYYSDWDCEIIVCDGSDLPFQFDFKNIIYIHLPNLPVVKKILHGINQVKTEYFCLAADDDFFIKSSFINGINFLQNNEDFVGVQGQFANFQIKDNEIYFCNSYLENNNRIISNNDFSKRIIYAFNNLTIHAYSLFRTNAAKKAIEVSSKLNSSVHCEICLIIFPLLYGKHLSTFDLWAIRDTARYTDHSKSDSKNYDESPYIDFSQYILTQEFFEYKKLFIQEVNNLNNTKTNSSLLFDEIFNIYIQKSKMNFIIYLKKALSRFKFLIKLNKKIFKSYTNQYKKINDLFDSDVKWAIKKDEILKVNNSILNRTCQEYKL